MHRFRLLLMFLLALTSSVALCAQAAPQPVDPHHVDGSQMGGLLLLSRNWLVKEGDDPRNADPNLDDTQWAVLRDAKPLTTVGITHPDVVWYRQHLKIPVGRKGLTMLIRAFGGSFRLFVNGKEIGNSGPEPKGGSAIGNSDQIFDVPDSAVGSGDLVIAVRGHLQRRFLAGTGYLGFSSGGSALILGPSRTLTNYASLYQFRNYTSNTINVLAEVVVFIIALALALAMRDEREYLWLAASFGASVLSDILTIWRSIQSVYESTPLFFLQGILSAIGLIAMLEFVRTVLGLKRNRWWAGYEWIIGIVLVLPVPLVNYSLFLGSGGMNASFLVVVQLIAEIFTLPVSVGLPLLALIVWWKRRSVVALLLFIPLFLQSVISYVQFAFFLLLKMHISDRGSIPAVPITTFNMQYSEIASFLFSLAMLIFLVLRTVRIAQSRAAMASDLHAVQSVQEILLARASHDTPGFRVDHVYHPASEVGGDFFLVSPGPDGSVTAILGDVSGKGLVAAMRVSMILGVLRREEDREPEAVLRNLNEALLMQGDMGFTTACCVRMQPDGKYTIANAGHISPYIGGKEIPTPSSLPLGMTPDEHYEQVTGFLPAGKTLVLMSDGVVEARNAKGELYGFDRLQQLTLMAAEDIADVARRFGQEDDITVMTLAREAA